MYNYAVVSLSIYIAIYVPTVMPNVHDVMCTLMAMVFIVLCGEKMSFSFHSREWPHEEGL